MTTTRILTILPLLLASISGGCGGPSYADLSKNVDVELETLRETIKRTQSNIDAADMAMTWSDDRIASDRQKYDNLLVIGESAHLQRSVAFDRFEKAVEARDAASPSGNDSVIADAPTMLSCLQSELNEREDKLSKTQNQFRKFDTLATESKQLISLRIASLLPSFPSDMTSAFNDWIGDGMPADPSDYGLSGSELISFKDTVAKAIEIKESGIKNALTLRDTADQIASEATALESMILITKKRIEEHKQHMSMMASR